MRNKTKNTVYLKIADETGIWLVSVIQTSLSEEELQQEVNEIIKKVGNDWEKIEKELEKDGSIIVVHEDKYISPQNEYVISLYKEGEE